MENIHYHGGPIWGKEFIAKNKPVTCKEVLYKNSCALISYARQDQAKYIIKNARSVILDNGAFKTYNDLKKGKIVNLDWHRHWEGFYYWVFNNCHFIDNFIIPDVIGGTEKENDRLLQQLPSIISHKGIPVWHSVESLERLVMLCKNFDKVAIGLCGVHEKTTSNIAIARLHEAFTRIYWEERLTTKIHGLRMLDGRILGSFPFHSADSSFVAINVPKTEKQMPTVKCKLARTAIYKRKIEAVTPPTVNEWLTKHYSESAIPLLLLG